MESIQQAIQSDKNILLSVKAYKMIGRQRLVCTLTLTDNGVVKVTSKRKGNLVFEANSKDISYSTSFLTKTRLMLASKKDPQNFIRLGVMKINRNSTGKKHSKARDTLVSVIKSYGAQENSSHPEEKLDKFFIKAIMITVSALIVILLIGALMN